MDPYDADSHPDPRPDSPMLGRRPKYVVPSLRQPVKVCPAATGIIIRYALAADIFFNVYMAIILVFFPKWILWVAKADESSPPTPVEVSLCQWFGTIIFAFTAQVGLVMPNTRGALESRRTVYWSFLSGECCLVPLFLYQSSKRSGSGLEPDFMRITAFLFFCHLVWRLFCLLVKPHWFGTYRNSLDGVHEA